MSRRLVLGIDLAAKLLLILLLLHAVVFPGLPQYHGKGIAARLATYPLSALLVPVAWAVLRRRRPGLAYPFAIDICCVLPFLIDTAGNALNLYDTVTWWDDAMHWVTWVPWVTAFGLAVRTRAHLQRIDAAFITAGFGAITHICWELLEYVTFIRDNPAEFNSAYTDTLGDLGLSLLGSVTGAVLISTVLWRKSGPATGARNP